MIKRKVLSPGLVRLMLFSGCTILFFMVVLSRNFVPAKLLYDEGTLKGLWNTTQTCGLWDQANGYVCTAIIYRTFNITLPVAIGIGAFAVPFAFLILPFVPASRARASAYAFSGILMVAVCWGAAAAIFNSGLNKELLTNIAIVIALLFIRRKHFMLATMAMVLYGVYIRPYWVIAAAFTWVAHLASKRFGPRWGLTALAVCLAGVTLVAAILLHAPLSSIRNGVNEYRIGSADARSMIMPYFDVSSPILEVASMFITWISLMLPWPLLFLGGMQQLLVAALMPVTVFLIIRAWHVAYGQRDLRCNFGCALFCSFLTVQAIFEPDYGSFVRHLCGFIPFGLLAIGLGNFRPEVVHLRRAAA